MSLQNPLSICLFGATGLIGHEVLQHLDRDERVGRLVAVTRSPLRKDILRITENRVINFEQLDRYGAELKADIYICCLGTTLKEAGSRIAFRKVDYEYVLAIGKLAEANKASQLQIISALGADRNSKVFYNKVKGEMEGEIMKLNIPEIDIYRPSLLLGSRREKRLIEGIGQAVAPILSPLLFGPLKKYRPIEAREVAISIVHHCFEQKPGRFIFESDHI